MASMKRMPKYTAGMFKRKMPRFGAAPIKKPRMPRPPKPSVKKPRVKKFQDGGSIDEQVVEFDPRDPKVADLLKRMNVPYEEIVRMRDRAIVRNKTGPYRGSGRAFKEPITGYDEETGEYYLIQPDDPKKPYKGKGRKLDTFRYNKGGSIDGAAVRGKTRGRFV